MIMMSRKVAFLALCAALLPQGLLAQAKTQLRPGDDLAAAVHAAAPGTILELAGGEYGAFDLKGLGADAGAPITLRSADPANPAKFSEMNLREVNHLVLDGLFFDYTYNVEDKSSIRPFQIFTSRDLIVRNSVFEGDLGEAEGPGEGAYPTGFGLAVRSSAKIQIENNEIRDFYRGLTVSDSVDVDVIGNDIHAIRMDGMNFAQVERLLVEGNHIHDFKRAVDSADHADMIQFWTAQTKRPSVNVTIRDNVLNSGQGWYTQSIFMRNEEVDTGRADSRMFYRNITIEGNVIINANAHGITVGETAGLNIHNNTLVHNARSDGKKKNIKSWVPQIRVAASSQNVRIERNVMSRLVGYKAQPSWNVADNFAVQDDFPTQPGFYKTVFAAAQTGDPRNIASFNYLKGGPLDGKGIGAEMLASKAEGAVTRSLVPQPELREIVVRVVNDPEITSRFSFDLSASLTEAGLDGSKASFAWDFGDGQTAQGQSVDHTFATPGVFDVLVQGTFANGKSITGRARVTSHRSEVLILDSRSSTYITFSEMAAEPLNLAIAQGQPIPLGNGHALISIPAEAIAPIFGSTNFQIDVRTRAKGGYKSAGTMLDIPRTLLVNVTGRGNLLVQFNTSEARTVKLSTDVLSLFSGEWLDLSFRYSAKDSKFSVFANGKLVGQGTAYGKLRSLEYWGLFLGFPFQNGKTFDGEIETLVLKVGTSSLVK